MSRRTVIGRLTNGDYGIRTSLPGFDALLDDEDDATRISFSSGWTNVAKIHFFGVSSMSTAFQTVPYPALPYMPFVELRTLSPSGARAYDDRVILATGGGQNAARGSVEPGSNQITILRNNSMASQLAIYIVYAESSV